VLVASERFGELEVDESSVLDFPDGLLGFSHAHRFAMIATGDDEVYYWLQSLDDPSLAFLSVIPWAFFPDYEPELADEDVAALALESAADAVVLCLLSVHRDEPSQVTCNLMGPLVVNATTRVGRQIVLNDPSMPVRAPLGAA
jgi:flagellar assembly factor FliW